MSATPEELKAFAAKHLPQEQPKQEVTVPPRHICVALLAYDAKSFIRSQISLAQFYARCVQLNWGFTYILRESDSMVARGRSLLASKFLTEEGTKHCTDLVFIDTDVYWDGDELVRLMMHDVDVVAGAYPFKNESGNFPIRWSSQGLMEVNGLWIVQAVTPGFMRIRRGVLERMVSEMPWLEFNDAHGDAAHRCWMFFDNLARPNGIYDEGYVFCERWRGVGGTVYVDPDIHLKHIGMKIYDHGTLRGWNDKRTKQVEELHHKYPNVAVTKLFNHTQGVKLDLEKEQAEAVARGDQRIVLEGVENRKLEGDDAQEAGPSPEILPNPITRNEKTVEPGSELPPPAAREVRQGANGVQPRH